MLALAALGYILYRGSFFSTVDGEVTRVDAIVAYSRSGAGYKSYLWVKTARGVESMMMQGPRAFAHQCKRGHHFHKAAWSLRYRCGDMRGEGISYFYVYGTSLMAIGIFAFFAYLAWRD